MRRVLAGFVGLAVLVVGVLAFDSAAFGAVQTRVSSVSFGGDGSSGTAFGDPDQLAVDQAGDRLYVLDKTGAKIHAFGLPGRSPVGGAFPLTGSATGADPDIAVDNSGTASAGNVYYVAAGVQQVFGFDSAGAALGGGFPIDPAAPKDLCGSAVDPDGALWIGDFATKTIRKFDSSGAAQGSVSTAAQAGSPCHVAFDSNGDMFVAMWRGATWRYDAPGYTTATQIDSVATRAIAVDRTAHRVYVAHDNRVSAYTTAGASLYEFASGIANQTLTGVAVDEGADTVYVSDTGAGDRVRVYPPAQTFGDAFASPTAATAVTDSTATIGASISDLNVLPTNWRLEVSANAGASWTTVSTGTTAGSQFAVPVTGNATNLVPNTDYRFRVVTNKGSTPATEVASNALTFRTLAVAPVASTDGASEVRDTSLRMTATVDPRNSTTAYVFQYGTTPALGTTTDPVAIGSGATPQLVSKVITGLQPNTTYYYRVVATNLIGATNGTTRAVTTRTPPPPSADRAYEMVTPTDKNYSNFFVSSAVARNGNAVTSCGVGGFGEPAGEVRLVCAGYLSRRGDDGWSTIAPRWPACSMEPSRIPGPGILSPNFEEMYLLRREGVSCAPTPFDPAAPLPSDNLYVKGIDADPATSSLLTPQAHTSAAALNGFADGTDDFGHVVYSSSGNQTSETATAVNKVYEWDHGTIRLVSKDTSNVPFATASTAITGQGTVNAISASGDRIFFQNGLLTANELYRRDNGASTVHISQSECTVSCTGAAGDTFEWATADGSKALFLSAAKLTDDGAFALGQNNLYRFTDSANPATDSNNLVLLSKDNEPADGTNAGVLGVSGISDDGNTVFFVANGQIVLGGPTAAGPKVYRWRWNGGNPTVQYLATLGITTVTVGGDPERYVWNDWVNNEVSRPTDVVVTGDGSRLILQTAKPLDPAADKDTTVDVYRWDAQEGWACLSCQAPSAPSAGASTLQGAQPSNTLSGTGTTVSVYRQRLVMTDGGDRVFFSSRDELVAADVNGDRSDVYEWHNGVLRLITSGTGVTDATLYDNMLLGVDSSGENVFFVTSDRLVGWDTDDNQDVYDARVGGGFAEPPPPDEVCDVPSGGCQSPGASEVGGSTETAGDPGSNAPAPPRAALSVKALTGAQRAALGRGAGVRMRLSVNQAGAVRVAGTARVGGRSRRVVSARSDVAGARAVAVSLRLSRAARRQLARSGRLRVRLVVSFSSARPFVSTVTVRRPAKKKRGSGARRATVHSTNRGR